MPCFSLTFVLISSLVAAVLGGFNSLPLAVAGSLGVGVAQYPPTDKTPAESSSDGLGSPDGAPAGGRGGRFHSRATDTPSATAEASGFGGVGPNVTVASSSSSSAGELLPDGTLVTRARAEASDVRIADVLSLVSVTTVAEATVPRTGEPTTTLRVTMAGVTLAGVPAQVTPEGLRISDQAPASPVSLAEFNAALAQLEARGITVSAAPLLEETTAGAARASGGALRIRYKVADQIGGDEEFTFTPASAKSAVSRREAEPPVVDADLPVDAPPAPGLSALGDAVPPSASAGTDGLAGAGTSSAMTSESLPFNGSPAYGEALSDPSTASATTAAGSPETIASAPDAPAGTAASDDLLLAAGRASDPAQRIRAGYAVVLLALVAGVAAVTVQFRIRPV